MAKNIFYDRVAVIGGHRISRDANQITIVQSRTEEETTVLEDKSRRYELGAWEGQFSLRGFTNDEIEARWLAELAKPTAPSTPLSLILASGTGAAGDNVAQVDGCIFSFNTSGDQGRVQGFEMAGRPHDRLMIGSLLESSVGTAGITGTQNGTAVNLGAVAADERLVVVYHVLNFPAVEGTAPTLDAKIQSATDEVFTTPVDRITLPQRNATPIGSVHELAGAVTDTWWRFSVTAVGGTATPKFWVVVSAAIVKQ